MTNQGIDTTNLYEMPNKGSRNHQLGNFNKKKPQDSENTINLTAAPG